MYSRYRVKIGEWLHILADKVLPIPAFAKGGTYIGKMGDTKIIESSVIVEGRDIYDLYISRGVDIQVAKDVMLSHAQTEVARNVLTHASDSIKTSVIQHGNNSRVYFEVKGILLVK